MRHTELKSLTDNLTGKENPKPCSAGNWNDYPSVLLCGDKYKLCFSGLENW